MNMKRFFVILVTMCLVLGFASITMANNASLSSSDIDTKARGYQLIDGNVCDLKGNLLIEMENGLTKDGLSLDPNFRVYDAEEEDIKPLTPVSDEVKLFNTLLTRQFDAIVSGEKVLTSDVFIETENTLLYQHFLEWRVLAATLLNSTYADYRYDIELQEVAERDGYRVLTFTGNIEYQYKENPMWCGQGQIFYTVSVIDTPEGIRISNIDTNEVMYSEFVDNIAIRGEKGLSDSEVEQRVKYAMDDLYVVAEQFRTVEESFLPDYSEHK